MSGPTKATVMGPDRRTLLRMDIHLLPVLGPDTDMYSWREEVQLWATTVERFASGGDKRAKGIRNNFGLTLFNAIDTVLASKVERAVTAGLLSLHPENGDGIDGTARQNMNRRIINIVAKDTPTDGIRRLMQMMRNVYNCTRKHGEWTELYERRFQSLELEYLNHCEAVAAERDSQNFSMLLLENANIPASDYNAVVNQLVSNANNRDSESPDRIYLISKETV